MKSCERMSFSHVYSHLMFSFIKMVFRFLITQNQKAPIFSFEDKKVACKAIRFNRK